MANEFIIKNGFISKGNSVVDGGLTATTISATTYYNLPPSTFTGGTVTGPTNFTNGLTANTLNVNGVNITGDTYTTGGTYSNGTIQFNYNTGGNFQVTGITSNDTYVTGFTYNDNTFTISDNSGSTYNATFNTVTGLTVNGILNVTGNTIQSGVTATTIYTDYIDFNTGATVTQSPGRISWDSGTGTLNVTVGDGDTGLLDLQVGQEEITRVFNDEATTLQRGEIVYVYGSQGNRPSVKRALATNDGYSVTTLGMVSSDILSGTEGYVTTFGIISNLNTLGLSGGTPIWLSPDTPGAYTSTKPIAPNHIVLIGYVVRVNATTGSVFINISNGWELDELHDVRISGATEGDLLVRSSYSGSPVWVNTKTLPGSYTITGNTNIEGGLNVTGNTVVSSLNANTLILTSTPTSSYDSTQILMRNSTTGQIEITDSTSPSIYNYGMTYAIGSSNYLI